MIFPSVTPQQRKVLVASSLGNILEWYDFALFGFFAPILAQLFFPSDNHLASLLSTFGVFAAGFLMRPLGGALFGHLGDRVGRKNALAASVILMAIPTTLLGLLPTHAQVGILAPLLLTGLRLIQGLSVGGELTGSISFIVEHSPPTQRGFFGSWASNSIGMGLLLGSATGALMTSLLSQDDLVRWGWRIPFLFGIFVGGVGLYLRMKLGRTGVVSEVTAGRSHVPRASPRSPDQALARDYYNRIGHLDTGRWVLYDFCLSHHVPLE